MENILELLGFLFFMFLVLAASVEVVLELFRGLLEAIGFSWQRGKISLDDSLKLAKEFSSDDKELYTKLQAVKSAAEQIEKKVSDKIQNLATLKDKLSGTGVNIAKLAAELDEIAVVIKEELRKSERLRMNILRAIAAIIGCFLVWMSEFYVFQILAQSADTTKWSEILKGLQASWINIIVGGFAAAAGSTYWHDKLDKLRNLKAATQEFKKLVP